MVTDGQSTQRSISLRVADFNDLTPVDRAEFAGEISPVLTLVAPTGMDRAERKTWLEAAYRALDGIPIGLLKRGADAAMRRADHPAKIVKAIFDEIGSDWDRRKLRAPRHNPVPQIAIDPVRRAREEAERTQVGALMKGLVRKLEARSDAPE